MNYKVGDFLQAQLGPSGTGARGDGSWMTAIVRSVDHFYVAVAFVDERDETFGPNVLRYEDQLRDEPIIEQLARLGRLANKPPATADELLGRLA